MNQAGRKPGLDWKIDKGSCLEGLQAWPLSRMGGACYMQEAQLSVKFLYLQVDMSGLSGIYNTNQIKQWHRNLPYQKEHVISDRLRWPEEIISSILYVLYSGHSAIPRSRLRQWRT